MPTTERDLCREAIRRTLRQRAGDSPDALAVARAASEVWVLMASRLIPVIGDNGVDAILDRSLRLTGVVFPWLADSGEEVGHAAFPARIVELMAGREPMVASQASSSLLITFTELLATLIGNSLTRRLLAPVWAAVPGAAEQDRAG